MDDAALVILCTAPNQEVAETLASGLVQAKLAACVNVIGGVRSFYRWQGELCIDDEVQLLAKTRRSRFEALRAWLEAHHPYDVPEILALPVDRGSKAYLGWLHAQT